jgi:hypothetical protein
MLHQQRRCRHVDDVVTANGLEFDGELAVRPREQPVERVGAREAADLGVDDLAVAEEDRTPTVVAVYDMDDAGLPVELDGLDEIDDADVG